MHHFWKKTAGNTIYNLKFAEKKHKKQESIVKSKKVG